MLIVESIPARHFESWKYGKHMSFNANYSYNNQTENLIAIDTIN